MWVLRTEAQVLMFAHEILCSWLPGSQKMDFSLSLVLVFCFEWVPEEEQSLQDEF